MGGTPFAALTEAGNFKPSILQVAGQHANTVRQAAIENAMSTAMYASTLAMTVAGKEQLDAILQPALRPVTAIIVGIAIEHYEILDPVSVVGNGLLIGGFSAMGAATTATANLAKSSDLGKMAATAASEGVKNVLGTLAFGLWAAGASLGGSVPKKATAAVDAHVPKAVEGGADAAGRVAVKGGELALKTSLSGARFAKETAASATNHTKNAAQAVGDGVTSVASAIGTTSQSAWNKSVGALRQRSAATPQSQAAQGQSIPMQPLAGTQVQASSSAPARQAAQDDGDIV